VKGGTEKTRSACDDALDVAAPTADRSLWSISFCHAVLSHASATNRRRKSHNGESYAELAISEMRSRYLIDPKKRLREDYYRSRKSLEILDIKYRYLEKFWKEIENVDLSRYLKSQSIFKFNMTDDVRGNIFTLCNRETISLCTVHYQNISIIKSSFCAMNTWIQWIHYFSDNKYYRLLRNIIQCDVYNIIK
jgi:hypothetical protein